MKKGYCTQNNGYCQTCSLVNYGLDCRNNPISEIKPKKSTPHARMMEAYGGFAGAQTLRAINEQISQELRERLTYREYGLVMKAVNEAYHNGLSRKYEVE